MDTVHLVFSRDVGVREVLSYVLTAVMDGVHVCINERNRFAGALRLP
jgi:hypothetical protein